MDRPHFSYYNLYLCINLPLLKDQFLLDLRVVSLGGYCIEIDLYIGGDDCLIYKYNKMHDL